MAQFYCIFLETFNEKNACKNFDPINARIIKILQTKGKKLVLPLSLIILQTYSKNRFIYNIYLIVNYIYSVLRHWLGPLLGIPTQTFSVDWFQVNPEELPFPTYRKDIPNMEAWIRQELGSSSVHLRK